MLSGAARRAGGFRLSVMFAACMLLHGCTSHGGVVRDSAVGAAAEGAADAALEQGDSARATFRFTRGQATGTYPSQFVHLWFDDGTGERYVPGEILAIDPIHYRYLRNDGRHVVGTKGQMQVRVLVTGSANLADTVGAATLTLALQPDWLWVVKATIAEADGRKSAAMIFPDSTVATPVRGRDGRSTGDVLYLSAAGASLSRPPNPR
jgi:hypothetical protein